MQIASESRSTSDEGEATENMIVGMASEEMKCTCTSRKVKFATTEYRGNRGVAPCILCHGSRWK